MGKHIIITGHKKHDIDIVDSLDIYQIEIVQLYEEAINQPNIRQCIYFLTRKYGLYSAIKKKSGRFFIDFNRENRVLQFKYNSTVIFTIKRILTEYHKKSPIVIKESLWANSPEIVFDTQKLTKNDRGILTKILKKENQRLALLGVKNRRQKRAYDRKIFSELMHLTPVR